MIVANEFAKLAEQNELSIADIRIAAATQLLLGGYLDRFRTSQSSKQTSTELLFSRLTSILSDGEIATVMKWASWISHVRNEQGKGVTVDELLTLRRDYLNGTSNISRSDSANAAGD